MKSCPKLAARSVSGHMGVTIPFPEELVREHYDKSMLMDCSVFYTVPTFYVLTYSIDSPRKYLLGRMDIADQMLLSVLSEFHPKC
jgi:hypothetical protein